MEQSDITVTVMSDGDVRPHPGTSTVCPGRVRLARHGLDPIANVHYTFEIIRIRDVAMVFGARTRHRL